MHRDTDELLGVGDSLPAAERYRARALLALNAVVLLVGLFVGAVAVATFVLVHEQVQVRGISHGLFPCTFIYCHVHDGLRRPSLFESFFIVIYSYF